MFRRLRSTQRPPKANEPKAAQDTAMTRVDPALTMALDDERDSQFSYPAQEETRIDSLRPTPRADDDEPAKGFYTGDHADSDGAADQTRWEDSVPGDRRGKLARAAARLPKAVDGVVTVKRGEGRRMVVGRDICLSGEIKSCDSLAVEGRVEADLTGCNNLEILPSGVVKGNATVQRCEVAGVFEGDLSAEHYLLVRAGGRIIGNVSYREIEVERGGHITGQMREIEAIERAEAEAPAAVADDAFDSDDYARELEEERARLKALQASA